MTPSNKPVRFLASVRSVAEARIVAHQGADIVDCKDPGSGALGALDLKTIAAIRAEIPSDMAVSATVGDDAAIADDVETIVCQTAATGVDFVKIGIEGTMLWQDVLSRLGMLELKACRLVAVLLADRPISLDMIAACANAKFAGVLLDTVDKSSGTLPDILAPHRISAFIRKAHDAGLFAGLAGALRACHIEEMCAYSPDILGFRGALCRDDDRQNGIDPTSVAQVSKIIDRVNQQHSAPLLQKVLSS